MKRFAYAAASTLTVAGWDFPHHIWFPFFFFFSSGLRSVSCKRPGQVHCTGWKHQTVALTTISVAPSQTRCGAKWLERRSVRWRWLISPSQVRGACVTQFWPHCQHLGQISAYASPATGAAKSLHPLTVSEVTGTPCRDKLLLFHLPPPPGLLCPLYSSCGRLRHAACEGWGMLTDMWASGTGRAGGAIGCRARMSPRLPS